MSFSRSNTPTPLGCDLWPYRMHAYSETLRYLSFREKTPSARKASKVQDAIGLLASDVMLHKDGRWPADKYSVSPAVCLAVTIDFVEKISGIIAQWPHDPLSPVAMTYSTLKTNLSMLHDDLECVMKKELRNKLSATPAYMLPRLTWNGWG